MSAPAFARAEQATLRDGATVLVRRLTPADAPMVADGFARLSEESRRLRFLTAKPQLSRRELRYLTEVDGHDHEALAAIDPSTRQGVGIARFVPDAPGSERAEVAVTVADEWQGRGLATALLARLSDRAREEGVRRFTALVARENEAMRDLLAHMGTPVRALDAGGGAMEYEIDLGRQGLGAQLREALRATAAGRLVLPASLRHALSTLVPLELRPRRDAD